MSLSQRSWFCIDNVMLTPMQRLRFRIAIADAPIGQRYRSRCASATAWLSLTPQVSRCGALATAPASALGSVPLSLLLALVVWPRTAHAIANASAQGFVTLAPLLTPWPCTADAEALAFALAPLMVSQRYAKAVATLRVPQCNASAAPLVAFRFCYRMACACGLVRCRFRLAYGVAMRRHCLASAYVPSPYRSMQCFPHS